MMAYGGMTHTVINNTVLISLIYLDLYDLDHNICYATSALVTETKLDSSQTLSINKLITWMINID